MWWRVVLTVIDCCLFRLIAGALLSAHFSLFMLGLLSGVTAAGCVLAVVEVWTYPYPWHMEKRRRDNR